MPRLVELKSSGMEDTSDIEPGTTDERSQVERKIVSVLFADIVGFTSLSERLDPEDVATIQDAYFATVRETIGRYQGTLEKFIGDAAMAVFGLPKTRDDDAERAVRAGLALISAIEQVGARLGFEEGDLRLRVGVNTGEVVHAESGPDAGRVTGDTVNTAARFQTAAPPNRVVVGEKTALAVAEAIELEEMEPLELKGKARPVRAWLAVGIRLERSRDHAMGSLRAPILGREAELRRLSESLSAAATGGGRRFLIVAPPGVGKTRVVDEFLQRMRGDGPAVVRARLRSDVVAPYDAVAQLMLDALAGAGLGVDQPDPASLSGQAMAILEERLAASGTSPARARVVVEEMAAVAWPPAEAEGEARAGLSAERETRFAAWIEGFDALAAGRTSLWVIEDIHWAGGDLLAFLAQAAKDAGPHGRLVLATSRPSLLMSAPAWGQEDEEEGTMLLELAPLSPTDAGDLVKALVGDVLPEGLVATIAARSDGNPLFIEELLRTWISVGTLAPAEGGGWRLTASADDVPLPATVQAIYSAQIDDLPPQARLAARRGAVAGRRFPVAALDALGVTEAAPAVEILRQRAMVAGPVPDALLGPGYSYRHALLRDAGYASLARAERARLHVRLARWLEQAAGNRSSELSEVIGNHYASALESTPELQHQVAEGIDRSTAGRLAASWFERAAEGALAIAAHDAATALYRRALDLTPEQATLDRARLLERLGAATAFAADMNEGAKALEDSLGLYRSLFGDARRGLSRTLSSLGMVWNQQLRFEDASDLAEDGLRTIGEGDDVETARLLYLRGWSTMMFAIRPGIREDFERALGLARTHGDPALELEAAHAVYQMQVEEGEVTLDQMLEHDRQVIALARELGNWKRVVQTTRMDAAMLAEDRAEESWPLLDQAAEVAEAHGLREEAAWIDYCRSETGFVSGEWERASEAGLRVIEVAERNAYHRAAVRTWFVLTAIAFAQDRRDILEHAHRWFDQHESIFPPSPYRKLMHGAIELRLTAADLRHSDSPDLEDLLPVWDETQGMGSVWDAVETIARAWLARGDLGAVRRWLDAMARWHTHPMTRDLGRGTHALIEARLDLAEGRVEAAASAARWAADAFRRCRAPWWVFRATRVLEAAGQSTPELSKEADRIEHALGIVKE
jgi:class 3 adenylate cyclase/tetratricopeptide (TPR) repeat protein